MMTREMKMRVNKYEDKDENGEEQDEDEYRKKEEIGGRG